MEEEHQGVCPDRSYFMAVGDLRGEEGPVRPKAANQTLGAWNPSHCIDLRSRSYSSLCGGLLRYQESVKVPAIR